MAGGGDRGTEAGIARITIVRDGGTIEMSPVFIEISPGTGEVSTENIAGKVMNGITSEYPIKILSETGMNGRNGKREGTVGRIISMTAMKELTLNEIRMIDGRGTNGNETITNGRIDSILKIDKIITIGVRELLLLKTQNQITTTGGRGLSLQTLSQIATTGRRGLSLNKITEIGRGRLPQR
jgi:hypothetical protein